jgi:membrane-bound lytic murein transglycosylase A
MSPALLEPIAFSDIVGWAADDHMAAFAAFCSTAHRISASSKFRAVGIRALVDCSQITSVEAARAFFEAYFVPHRVRQEKSKGLLTGYYEPVLQGSRVPTAEFQVPVYRRPPDLENCVAESERGAKSSGFTHLRRTGTGLEPYATRAAIEQGALRGPGLELVYLACPVAAFFLHVQGSGLVMFPDGTHLRLTYDGKNGHPYTSIGRTLIVDGVMSAADLTLQTLEDWLRADLARAKPILWRNESFVFFKPLLGDAAEGVLGTALHAGRSLAVDTAFHELGMPIYVSSPGMTHVGPDGFRRLMVAHDVGSAIKGVERGDIYFGSGPVALALAGITKHEATFTVLCPGPGP